MERVRFITHKGKNILFIDLSNLSPKDGTLGLDTIAKAREMVKKQPKDAGLSLTYVKGSTFSKNSVRDLKELAKEGKEYDKKAAVVGVEGILKVAYYAVTRFSERTIPLFDSIDEAKDWLVED